MTNEEYIADSKQEIREWSARAAEIFAQAKGQKRFTRNRAEFDGLLRQITATEKMIEALEKGA